MNEYILARQCGCEVTHQRWKSKRTILDFRFLFFHIYSSVAQKQPHINSSVASEYVLLHSSLQRHHVYTFTWASSYTHLFVFFLKESSCKSWLDEDSKNEGYTELFLQAKRWYQIFLQSACWQCWFHVGRGFCFFGWVSVFTRALYRRASRVSECRWIDERGQFLSCPHGLSPY